MSDQRFPDGEYAKVALQMAKEILFNIEKKTDQTLTREEFLKAVSQAEEALRGHYS